MRIIDYIVPPEHDGLKIFTFLKYKNGYSTKLIRTIKTDETGILLNGKPARTIDLVHAGDRLTVSVPSGANEIAPVEGKLDLIYEDEDILVINKSPFTAMHPTHNHQGDTLANNVAFYLQ